MKPIDLNAPYIKLEPTTSNDSDALPAGAQQVRIVNRGPSGAWLKSSSAASTTAVVDQNTFIPAGNTETFSVDQSHRSIGAICESGSAELEITCGPGY